VADIFLGLDWSGIGWVNSVEVRPEHRGRGYGRAAMLVGEQKTLAGGNSLLGLNVIGHNTTAIGLYEKLGYAVVDETRTISFQDRHDHDVTVAK